MTELTGILILAGLLLGLLALIAAPIVLALFVVAAVLKLVFFLVLLPFRILGWGLGLGFAALGLLVKGTLLAGAVALLIVFGLVPLVPVLLLGLLIYFLARPSRKGPAPAPSA